MRKPSANRSSRDSESYGCDKRRVASYFRNAIVALLSSKGLENSLSVKFRRLCKKGLCLTRFALGNRERMGALA